jgi:site-specific recombinase XerD
VEPATLEAFCGLWLHKRGVVARSRKPYISGVKRFYAWAAAQGLLARDPGMALKHPKVGQRLPEAISLASAERLMWAPDMATFKGVRDAAILALLVGCGLRVSGVVGLNESDVREVDADGRVRLVVRVLEKGDRERLVPVPREAELILRVYLEHEALRSYDRDVPVPGRAAMDRVLFVNTRHTLVPADEHRGELLRLSRQTVWRMIKAYGRKVGVPERELHPHAFRHLFGTELAEEEEDLLMRQSLMGHADPKSTEIYTHLTLRRRVSVVDRSGPLGKVRSPMSELLKRLDRG